jgi:hypothetical protein
LPHRKKKKENILVKANVAKGDVLLAGIESRDVIVYVLLTLAGCTISDEEAGCSCQQMQFAVLHP